RRSARLHASCASAIPRATTSASSPTPIRSDDLRLRRTWTPTKYRPGTTVLAPLRWIGTPGCRTPPAMAATTDSRGGTRSRENSDRGGRVGGSHSKGWGSSRAGGFESAFPDEVVSEADELRVALVSARDGIGQARSELHVTIGRVKEAAGEYDSLLGER